MLSKEHRKLLIQIEKGKVIRSCLENKDLDYLYDLKLIEMTIYPEPTDPFVLPYLTEHGKAYLENYRTEKRRHITNIVISILIAVITTAASILL